MSKKSAGSFIGGMLLGSAIGTLTGLLIAPRTGRDTRQLLKKSADALPELAEDLSTSVQLQADRLSESARLRWDGTLTRLREAINAGVEASQREGFDEIPQPKAEVATSPQQSVPDHQL
jgi:gas vesicle protein